MAARWLSSRTGRIGLCLAAALLWCAVPSAQLAIRDAVVSRAQRVRESRDLDNMRTFLDVGHLLTTPLAIGMQESLGFYAFCTLVLYLLTGLLGLRAAADVVLCARYETVWRLVLFLGMGMATQAFCWFPVSPRAQQREPDGVAVLGAPVVVAGDGVFAPRVAWILSSIVMDGSLTWGSVRFVGTVVVAVYVLSARQMFTVSLLLTAMGGLGGALWVRLRTQPNPAKAGHGNEEEEEEDENENAAILLHTITETDETDEFSADDLEDMEALAPENNPFRATTTTTTAKEEEVSL